MTGEFKARQINGGVVSGTFEKGFTLELPKIGQARYSLAQIDDTMHLPRRKFIHKPPLTVQLEARVSNAAIPGTWGFGLWNDPFSMGFAAGGMSRLLPVLPNAAWFFYGSDENHLTLREGQPEHGFHAKTFRSPLLPAFVTLLSLPILPLLFWPTAARFLRRMARALIKEDGRSLSVDPERWHVYRLTWLEDKGIFHIDNEIVFLTPLSPLGRLGLVIWIDNQYMRLGPSGKFGFGSLPLNTEHWLEIRKLQVSSGISEQGEET